MGVQPATGKGVEKWQVERDAREVGRHGVVPLLCGWFRLNWPMAVHSLVFPAPGRHGSGSLSRPAVVPTSDTQRSGTVLVHMEGDLQCVVRLTANQPFGPLNEHHVSQQIVPP